MWNEKTRVHCICNNKNIIILINNSQFLNFHLQTANIPLTGIVASKIDHIL
jgi:hypothetical protein